MHEPHHDDDRARWADRDPAADRDVEALTHAPAEAPLAERAESDLGLRVQLIRFIISGVISAVVDLGTTLICNSLLGTPIALGKTAGWVLGTLTAYVINSRWTFDGGHSWRRAAAVAVLYVITFATQLGIFRVMVPWLDGTLGWNFEIAQTAAFVVAQGVATAINFVVQRTVIFRVR
ncbi:GtrA family protein [Corynebacterium sp. 335C]